MSTIIKFDLKELKKLAVDKNSCVIEKRVTQNLALQPWCLGNLKESIKNLLDYKIGKFDKEFNGILLSYKNLRVLQNVGTIRNDNADIHFQVQADYFIFQPFVGATLRGIINKKSTTHLGILVHKVFNVVIPRPTEEPGNKWIGTSVQEGQEISFRIVVLDLYGALPYIRGELDESCLKLAQEENDDLPDSKPQPLNVSYIDFDKTKPNILKQSGDGLTHASKNNTKLLHSSKQIKNYSPDYTSAHNGISKKTSEISVKEKGKSKRTSNDVKHVDGNTKSSKKYKQDE